MFLLTREPFLHEKHFAGCEAPWSGELRRNWSSSGWVDTVGVIGLKINYWAIYYTVY